LQEHGIRFENSASEATAAATLAASVNYPLRGAVTFKATVGTNVASDALANLASGGVTGGALIVVGEDYGEGSSIMQERSHAFAMKSQIWLLDPRPNLPSMVKAVKMGFELSEASHTPVMLQLRIRPVMCMGASPPVTMCARALLHEAMEQPAARCQPHRVAARELCARARKGHPPLACGGGFIEKNQLNEFFEGDPRRGHHGARRQLQRLGAGAGALGLADVYGRSRVPLYVMNVAYPVVDARCLRFCQGKRAVLLVEEGQPNFVEQNVATVLRQAGCSACCTAKTCCHRRANTPPRCSKGCGPLPAVLGVGFGCKRPALGFALTEATSGALARPRQGPQSDCAQALAATCNRAHPAFAPAAPSARFLRHEVGRKRTGCAPCQRRHWLPPVFHLAAVSHWQHHHGLWFGHRWFLGHECAVRARRPSPSWAMAAFGTTA
jgi:hypothetical protein